MEIVEAKNAAAYAVIRYLNKMGVPVLEINGRFYSVKMFDEANQNSWKHTLEGKDITALTQSFVHINELDSNQVQAVYQKLDASSDVKKFFHKDYKFILHLQ